jgi:hypothetical protein
MIDFWDMIPCRFVEVGRRFSLIMEAIRTSKTSVYFFETTRRHIPKGCHILILRQYFKIQSLSFHVVPNSSSTPSSHNMTRILHSAKSGEGDEAFKMAALQEVFPKTLCVSIYSAPSKGNHDKEWILFNTFCNLLWYRHQHFCIW